MDFEIFLVQNLEIFTNNTAHSNVCLETQKARVVPVQAVNMDPPTLNSELNSTHQPGPGWRQARPPARHQPQWSVIWWLAELGRTDPVILSTLIFN